MPSDAYSQHALESTPNPANSLTSTFVAVNRVSISRSSATNSCSMTSTHNAPSLSRTSALRIASYTSTSDEGLHVSLSANSQRLRRREDATSAQMSHSLTPLAPQVSLSDPRREDTTEEARSASRIGKRRFYIEAQNSIKEAIRSYFKSLI